MRVIDRTDLLNFLTGPEMGFSKSDAEEIASKFQLSGDPTKINFGDFKVEIEKSPASA